MRRSDWRALGAVNHVRHPVSRSTRFHEHHTALAIPFDSCIPVDQPALLYRKVSVVSDTVSTYIRKVRTLGTVLTYKS